MRRIGVLMGGAPEMADQQAGLAVFMQLLHQLGWTEDRNVQLEIQWGGGAPDGIGQSGQCAMSTGNSALLRM